MANAHTDIIYTGRINDLNSELVVMPGTSDWGDQGWFIAEEIRVPGREPFITPKVFFIGDAKKKALTSAMTEEFYGY